MERRGKLSTSQTQAAGAAFRGIGVHASVENKAQVSDGGFACSLVEHVPATTARASCTWLQVELSRACTLPCTPCIVHIKPQPLVNLT